MFTRRQILRNLAAMPLTAPWLLGGCHASHTSSSIATQSYADYAYHYQDYWDATAVAERAKGLTPFGTAPALAADIRAAERIVNAAPTTSPMAIMEYFADLREVGSTGEPFNSRWKRYENPVIVWFFHATQLTPDGDCTSWCAAFLSWSLERAGIASMHSASSQDYLRYKTEVAIPAPGDIVVFQNVGDPAHGHVALVLEDTPDQIRIIGGNQNPGVPIPSCPRDHPISSIGRAWRPKIDAHQFVKSYRRY